MTTETTLAPLYNVGDTVIDMVSGRPATVAARLSLGYATPGEHSYRIAIGDPAVGQVFKTVNESDLEALPTKIEGCYPDNVGHIEQVARRLYEEQQQVPATDAVKHDEGKLRFDLVPYDALEEVVRVYTVGATKYGDRNWEKGMDFGRVFAAIQRHLSRFWQGDDLDEEDSLSHLAHATWGCLALLHYQLSGEHLKHDDRRRS